MRGEGQLGDRAGAEVKVWYTTDELYPFVIMATQDTSSLTESADLPPELVARYLETQKEFLSVLDEVLAALKETPR